MLLQIIQTITLSKTVTSNKSSAVVGTYFYIFHVFASDRKSRSTFVGGERVRRNRVKTRVSDGRALYIFMDLPRAQ